MILLQGYIQFVMIAVVVIDFGPIPVTPLHQHLSVSCMWAPIGVHSIVVVSGADAPRRIVRPSGTGQRKNVPNVGYSSIHVDDADV